MSGFTIGQICKGEGLVFEVINLYPLRVRCIENSGWWGPDQYGKNYLSWKVGEEYELYFAITESRNWNFKDHRLPWCSIYESGKVESH